MALVGRSFIDLTPFILHNKTYIGSFFSSPYQHVPTRNPLQNNQLDETLLPANEKESLQQVPSRNSQNIIEDDMYDDSSSNPERCSSSSSMASQALTDQVQISSILDVIIIILNTQVSSLKYPGILLFFFVGGGEIVREGGYY